MKFSSVAFVTIGLTFAFCSENPAKTKSRQQLLEELSSVSKSKLSSKHVKNNQQSSQPKATAIKPTKLSPWEQETLRSMTESLSVDLAPIQSHSILKGDESEACGSGRPRVINLNRDNSSSGTLTSDGYPETYPLYTLCEWRITPGEPNLYILLDFSSFNTYKNLDFVYVYEGSSSGTQVGSYTGDLVSPTYSLVFNTDMYVTFQSNYYKYPGFKALFTVDQACAAVGSILPVSGLEGVITSPFYPETYTSGTECYWQIDLDTYKVAILYFTSFNVGDKDDSGTCLNAYFRVTDEATLAQTHYCGTEIQSPLILQASKFQLYFFSPDDAAPTAGQGLKAEYRIIDVSLTTAEVSETTTAAPDTTTTTTSAPDTTTTTSSAPSTSVPPSNNISPDPHVVLTMVAYFNTSDHLTFDCSTQYMLAFKASFQEMITIVNYDIARGNRCSYSPEVRADASDVMLNEQGYTTRIQFNTLVNPTGAEVIDDVEHCAFEVEAYLDDPDNWRHPIIPYIPGCPTSYLDPYSFDSAPLYWMGLQ